MHLRRRDRRRRHPRAAGVPPLARQDRHDDDDPADEPVRRDRPRARRNGRQFREKPQTDDWINIGYFIFEPGVFDYLDGDETVLEEEPLPRLAEDGQIAAFPHRGFWQPMDTYRESQLLNELWNSGNPPWKVWE